MRRGGVGGDDGVEVDRMNLRFVIGGVDGELIMRTTFEPGAPTPKVGELVIHPDGVRIYRVVGLAWESRMILDQTRQGEVVNLIVVGTPTRTTTPGAGGVFHMEPRDLCDLCGVSLRDLPSERFFAAAGLKICFVCNGVVTRETPSERGMFLIGLGVDLLASEAERLRQSEESASGDHAGNQAPSCGSCGGPAEVCRACAENSLAERYAAVIEEIASALSSRPERGWFDRAWDALEEGRQLLEPAPPPNDDP